MPVLVEALAADFKDNTPGVLTISDHPHVLNYSQSLRHHHCDLCKTEIKKHPDGYRCREGCDFDVCMKCAKGYNGPRPAQSSAERFELKALEAQISRDFDALSTDLATLEKMSWY
jgi:hypothetical protein